MATTPTPPANGHTHVAWVVVWIGAVCLVASVAELVEAGRPPEEPRSVTLQDVIDRKVGDGDLVAVRDYRLCRHYVPSWDRRGRVNPDRLWCTGLVVPGDPSVDRDAASKPRVIYKPACTYAAVPFFEEFQKQGELRGRLSRDVGLSAFEQAMIEGTYPEVRRSSCLCLYEEPPPREPAESWRGVAFGAVFGGVGFAFTGPGRRLGRWVWRRVTRRPTT